MNHLNVKDNMEIADSRLNCLLVVKTDYKTIVPTFKACLQISLFCHSDNSSQRKIWNTKTPGPDLNVVEDPGEAEEITNRVNHQFWKSEISQGKTFFFQGSKTVSKF